MFEKLKQVLFEWPDPDETELAKVNKAYDSLNEELGYLAYPIYLRTKHWLHIEEEALKMAANQCQKCHRSDINLSVYHINDNSRGRETFNDVIVLCEACHTKSINTK